MEAKHHSLSGEHYAHRHSTTLASFFGPNVTTFMSAARWRLAEHRTLPGVAAVFWSGLYANITGPLLPYYHSRFGWSDSSLGYLTAAYPLGVILTSLPAGRATGRLGPFQTATIGVIVVGLSSILFTLPEPFAALIALRLAQGAGGTLIWIALLASYQPQGELDSSAQHSGLMMGAASAAGVVAPLLGTLARSAGAAAVFLPLAAPAPLFALLFLALVRDAPLITRQPIPFRSLARGPAVYLGVFLTLLTGIFFGVQNALGPLRLTALHASPRLLALILALAAALPAIGNPISGRIATRHSLRALLLILLVANFGAAAIQAAPLALTALATVYVLASLTFAALLPISSDLIAAHTQGPTFSSAYAFALWNVAWGLGQTIGSASGPTLASAATDTAPYLICAALVVCALATSQHAD
jgi:MFS family permease